MAKTKICFVCLGNICRSPIAEGVMDHLVRQAGLEAEFEIESAGTGDYHVGELADPRARAAALKCGVTLVGRARQITGRDFERFDYLLAMDASNVKNLLALAPPEHRHKVRLLRAFEAGAPPNAAVKDPYQGEPRDFDDVVQICWKACSGLLEALRQERAPQGVALKS